MQRTTAVAAPVAAPSDADRVLALLRQHGHDTTSFQTLEPGLDYWFDGDDACVAYFDSGRAWIAAGGPIAPPQRRAAVIEAFAAAARQRRRRVRFFAVERAPQDAAWAALVIGEQPSWNPRGWQRTLAQRPSLREQLRRARAKGVAVRAVAPAELRPGQPTRVAVAALLRRWLASRPMAPLGFVASLDPFSLPDERRFWVAERDRRLCGMLVAVPVYARNGWLLEDALRDPAAPNGTMELLIDRAMQRLAEEGAPHVTFGLAPLAGVRSRWLRSIRDRSRWLYSFAGLRAFKQKLQPDAWSPVYLLHPRGERGALAVLDSLRAFAGGSLLRFGWRTALHRAPDLTWLLAWLLVPWTALLAIADTDQWFPSPGVQQAWIGVDALLFVGLVSLAARWRRSLATLLALAAAADFAAGCAQAVMFNLHQPLGAAEVLVIAVALLAPLAAAIFLWCSRGPPRGAAPVADPTDPGRP